LRSSRRATSGATGHACRAGISTPTASCSPASGNWRVARAPPGPDRARPAAGAGPGHRQIFGTTRRSRLKENLGALEVRLACGDQLLFKQVFAAGARDNAASLATLDRQT